MKNTNEKIRSATEAVDWIFTYSTTQPSWLRTNPLDDLPIRASAPTRAQLEPPPPIKDDGDLRSANEWLQREWDRLQQYTEMQLARLQQESQAVVNQNALNEQSMVLGCQELSRKEELLARQSRALQQQAAELSQREGALVDLLAQWSRAQNELADLHQVRVRTEQETEEHQALLTTLRAETVALQRSRASTQTELETLARELDEQREARVKEQALARALQVQMEKRRRALDQAEQAAQRRAAELDELEDRLREEFAQQERQMAERRRDLAALTARLRST